MARAKVLYTRRWGHLWQVLYGVTAWGGVYGYGATKRIARLKARERYDGNK